MDTPGFGDSDNDDNNLINEMVDVLKDVVKTANGFVLLFNGMSERFDTKAQQMLREFEVTQMISDEIKLKRQCRNFLNMITNLF